MFLLKLWYALQLKNRLIFNHQFDFYFFLLMIRFSTAQLIKTSSESRIRKDLDRLDCSQKKNHIYLTLNQFGDSSSMLLLKNQW